MNFAKTAAVAAALSLLAAPAFAQVGSAYGNLGAKTIEFDTYSLEGKLGYQFTDYFSVEGQGSVGIIGDDEDGFEIDESYSLGGFFRASTDVGERFNFFGRIGYAVTEFEVEDVADLSVDGVAYGFGGEYVFDTQNGVRLEYTAYDFGEENGVDIGTADTVSLSYVRRF